MAMSLFVLLCFVHVLAAQELLEEGDEVNPLIITSEAPWTEDDEVEPHIVGGHKAKNGQFPFMVALTRGSSLCSATLISDRLVLTAAHCLEDVTNEDIGKWRLVAGSVNRSNPAVSVQIESVHPHPGYNSQTLKHDIGVVVTRRSLAGKGVRPICLASSSKTGQWRLSKVMAIGWGRTKIGRPASEILRFVKQQVRERCEDNMICTGIGTCEGDSGGPLVAYRRGRYVQVGVTSDGDKECKVFSRYTRVSYYKKFLLQFLKKFRSKICFA